MSLAWGTDVVAGGRGGGDRRGEALGVAGGREMWRAAAAAGGEAEREREDRKRRERWWAEIGEEKKRYNM